MREKIVRSTNSEFSFLILVHQTANETFLPWGFSDDFTMDICSKLAYSGHLLKSPVETYYSLFRGNLSTTDMHSNVF